jgi:hypothetical protein
MCSTAYAKQVFQNDVAVDRTEQLLKRNVHGVHQSSVSKIPAARDIKCGLDICGIEDFLVKPQGLQQGKAGEVGRSVSDGGDDLPHGSRIQGVETLQGSKRCIDRGKSRWIVKASAAVRPQDAKSGLGVHFVGSLDAS